MAPRLRSVRLFRHFDEAPCFASSFANAMEDRKATQGKHHGALRAGDKESAG
jgi:hypothetical protein